jgi:biotin carboxyl carrier protein
MKIQIALSTSRGGKETRTVELARDGDRWRATLLGSTAEIDAVEIAPHVFSVLLDGSSHEVRVSPAADGALKIQLGTTEMRAEIVDPRAWRGRHGALAVEGRQQVVSPMPGKIIRILIQPGDAVAAGQGLLVIEAMKMQNEIRSPKNGTIEKVLAEEGQAVNAGDVLVWVD